MKLFLYYIFDETMMNSLSSLSSLNTEPLTDIETLELENSVYELIGDESKVDDAYTLATVDSTVLLLRLEDFFRGVDGVRIVVRVNQFSALSMLYGFICSFLERNELRVHLNDEADDERTVLNFENLEWMNDVDYRLKQLERSTVRNSIVAIPTTSSFNSRKGWMVVSANPSMNLTDQEWINRTVYRLAKWKSHLTGYSVVVCRSGDDLDNLKQLTREHNGVIFSGGTKPQSILSQVVRYDDFFLIDCYSKRKSKSEVEAYIEQVISYGGGLLQMHYLIFAENESQS